VVDPLVPQVLDELDAPSLTVQEAGDIYAVLLAHRTGGDELDIVRALARLSYTLDYPSGRIGQAYNLAEYIDCECHADGKADARRFVRELRADAGIDLPEPLAQVLLDG